MVSLPATYQLLVQEIRRRFPTVSAVYNVVVLFQPANVNGGLLQNWVEVDASAYSAIHNGAELFVNVAHPLTKEYILPLPGKLGPNHHHRKQVRRTDGFGNRVGNEADDFDATAGEDDQVSKTRPIGASHKYFNSSVSFELERPGGDVFTSGWAGASERFRRSMKLVPNLKDCKEAIGQTVGQSNFYPDDEEEKSADVKLEMFQHQDQNQGPQATEAGWYAGGEVAQGDENRGGTEAQHLAGGLDEGQDEGKRNTLFYSDDANRNWVAASHSPLNSPEAMPRGHGGQLASRSPRWGGYRTPSPQGWGLYDDGGNNMPEYVQSRRGSPADAGAENWGSNPGGWNSPHYETNDANHGYSHIVAGPGDHPEAGHLTNGTQANGGHTNGAHTNGVTTNGNLSNGYPAAHSEVSQNPQHRYQHHGGSDWSPVRPQSNAWGLNQPRFPRFQGYQPHGQTNTRAFAGPRPRRDPAEVTYGSPRPRIQGSATGWTTMGRKKKTWTNNFVQEGGPEEPQRNGNNDAWYAQPSPPPLINFNRATGHGGASTHRGYVRHDTNNYQQKQTSGPAMTWGTDFWGGAPPERTQRGAFAQNETPASKHWQ